MCNGSIRTVNTCCHVALCPVSSTSIVADSRFRQVAVRLRADLIAIDKREREVGFSYRSGRHSEDIVDHVAVWVRVDLAVPLGDMVPEEHRRTYQRLQLGQALLVKRMRPKRIRSVSHDEVERHVVCPLMRKNEVETLAHRDPLKI